MNDLENLLSLDAQVVGLFLKANPTISTNDLGLWAWVFARWQTKIDNNRHRGCIEKKHFQSWQLGWRDFQNDSEDLINEICVTIKQKIRTQLSDNETDNLLIAADIFNVAYSEVVEVGNGNTDGYDENVPCHWEFFKPYRAYFEIVLGRTQVFDNEWITVAQVMWEHCRWVGDRYQDYFCEEAVGYFLAKAVELNPSIHLHYVNLRSKRSPYYPTYRSPNPQDEFLQLKSKLGLTYLYYAQYLYYQAFNYDLALSYYQKFVENEPDLLPNNIFRFKSECAYERMYPPSIQTALTEMGCIYLKINDLEKAEFYFQKAISIRKDNFQAPYQLLAEIKMKQGKVTEALDLWTKKIETFSLPPKKQILFEVHYAPQNPQEYALEGDYYRRIEVSFAHEYALRIADLYFQAQNFEKAQVMYKKVKDFLNDKNYADILYFIAKIDSKPLKIKVLEKQMQIAFSTKDFWQARSISEQILKTDSQNQSALEFKELIKKSLN